LLSPPSFYLHALTIFIYFLRLASADDGGDGGGGGGDVGIGSRYEGAGGFDLIGVAATNKEINSVLETEQ
jgi:hypothetical protein